MIFLVVLHVLTMFVPYHVHLHQHLVSAIILIHEANVLVHDPMIRLISHALDFLVLGLETLDSSHDMGLVIDRRYDHPIV